MKNERNISILIKKYKNNRKQGMVFILPPLDHRINYVPYTRIYTPVTYSPSHLPPHKPTGQRLWLHPYIWKSQVMLGGKVKILYFVVFSFLKPKLKVSDDLLKSSDSYFDLLPFCHRLAWFQNLHFCTTREPID